ncbi:MAG TPA: hypothetical protein DDW54_00355 [Clostridiales bacterium]|nr:hypothetical protein [Clostridiales bacterium]
MIHKIYSREYSDDPFGISFKMCYNSFAELHDQDYYEFVIVTKGKIKHIKDGKEFVAGEKTAFFLRPDDRHGFEPVGKENCNKINIFMSKTAFKSLIRSCFDEEFEKTAENRRFQYFKLSDADFKHCAFLIDKINVLPSGGDAQNKFNTAAILRNLISYLLIVFSGQWSDDERSEFPEPWFEEFLGKLEDPAVFTSQIKDVYRLAPYSQTFLSRYFKKIMNETLVEYVVKIRINYACNLLLNTDYTVLEISNKVSYSSLSHFLRTFKKITGKTPTQYREPEL